MNRIGRLALAAAVLTLSATGSAQDHTPDLVHTSIEDLMNIEITSASRKEQRASDVPGAIFVITQDDIHRSGMTTVPDVLRLAPGIEVAQINSNKWAVSVRGFNSLRSNKLLILIDGRSVYNRIFSGVLWDSEDVVLDDVERIEVIRGPGAALWGANAVNGVINIITKTAAGTQGALVRGEGGRADEQGLARYGGTLGAAQYRIYSQWTHREESLIAPGTRANDASHSTTSGFRVDWATSPDAFMLEGNLTAGQARALWPNLDPQTAARNPIADAPSDNIGGYVAGRWTHTRPNGATLQLQSSIDVASRDEPVGNYDRREFDVDASYHATFGTRHDVVAGAGYRFIDEALFGKTGFSLTPPENTASLATAFLQDEIDLFGRRLALTLGSQAQYDSVSGGGLQPNARIMWKALPRQRLWAATSRALRTPSLQDRGIQVILPPAPSAAGLPVVVVASGNPASETETLNEVEAGYRIEIGTTASIDVTTFMGRYAHLHTNEQAAPIVQLSPAPQIVVNTQFGNLLAASTRGVEMSGHWAPVPMWHLDGSYTSFHIAPQLAAESHDPTAAVTDANTPEHQWQLHSAVMAGTRATVNLALFHVGPITQQQVPSYTRADANIEWRFTSHLSAMAIGQNLFDPAHTEFTSVDSLVIATQVARSGSVRLRWTF